MTYQFHHDALASLRQLPGVIAVVVKTPKGGLFTEVLSDSLLRADCERLAAKSLENSEHLRQPGMGTPVLAWQFDAVHLFCGFRPDGLAVVLLASSRPDLVSVFYKALSAALSDAA